MRKKYTMPSFSLKNSKCLTFFFFLQIAHHNKYTQSIYTKCYIILIYSVELLTGLLTAKHRIPGQPSYHPTGK